MHPFIPNTKEDKERIFKVLGINSFSELLKDIPEELFYKGEINLPTAVVEQEAEELLKELAEENKVLKIFAGAGAYDHYVPKVIDYIASRPEFYTAYTPYQAEVSQGTLQAIFEFQSMICRLTGMDVTNASMYDGASSLAEAILMAIRIKRKNRVIISDAVDPKYKRVIETYLDGPGTEIVYVNIDPESGQTDLKDIEPLLDSASAFVVQHPNYFGVLERMDDIVPFVKKKDVLFIQHYNPISLGILKKPVDYMVDIATAEGQPLGLPLNFGGPYIGLFSSKKEYMRQMPGRIIGETVDLDGNKGYVMTLQTREQHIRRERATSNICSNQNLCALRVLVYLAVLGRSGLKNVARASFSKAHYLAERIEKENIGNLLYNGPFFNEFVIKLKHLSADEFIEQMSEYGLLAGVKIDDKSILVAVTEKKRNKELDEYVDKAKKILKEN